MVAIRRRMLIWIPAVLVLAVTAIWLAQRRLVYLPTSAVPPIEAVLPGWSDVTLTTSDGLELAAWYRAPQADAPVFVVFNGNAGNRAGRAPLGSGLSRSGGGVLLVDYRGYGGNPGAPTEAGLARDARAAASFVAATAPGHPLVLYGESLGAAVAIDVAREAEPAALVLRSPFTSLADVGARHYPFLPVRWLLWDEYPSSDRIAVLDVPVLVIAGSDDSIVPVSQSRQMYELAPDPKKLLILDGADHNDFELVAGRELVDTVLGFVDQVTEPR